VVDLPSDKKVTGIAIIEGQSRSYTQMRQPSRLLVKPCCRIGRRICHDDV
jgi:hypothetical protein